MDVLQGISGIDTAQRATTSSTADAESKKLGRDDFLTMFLAQLKNQDPLNPADSMQFVSQLAQFSELEQVIAIRAAVEAKAGSSQTAETPATGGN